MEEEGEEEGPLSPSLLEEEEVLVVSESEDEEVRRTENYVFLLFI